MVRGWNGFRHIYVAKFLSRTYLLQQVDGVYELCLMEFAKTKPERGKDGDV